MCVQNIPFIPRFKIKLIEFSPLENSTILIIIRKKNHYFFQNSMNPSSVASVLIPHTQ